VFFVNTLKNVNFADRKPSPTCDVPSSFICDGYNSCGDWSDEIGCRCPSYKPFECDCYQSDDGCTVRQGCMAQSEVCNGNNECGDWSDEIGCRCPSDKPFECECYQSNDGCIGRWGCMPQSEICNRVRSCSDWSDEKFCLNTTLYCRNDECVERWKVNDGKVDMTGGHDEFVCCASQGHKCGCIPGNDNCTSGKCIPNIWIGDARDDCNTSHSDEPCKAIKVLCENCEVIINACSTNESKMFLLQYSNENTTTCHMTNPSFHHLSLSTKWVCISSLCGKCLGEIFQCENGHVIDNAHFCDTNAQCLDRSDELRQNFGFRCAGKSRKSTCVLPQKNLYDSTSQCADGLDICFADGEFRCFLCLDEKLIISVKQVCDRNIDCFDGSDELLCSNQSVAQALVGENGSRCPTGQIHCNSSTEYVAMDKILCNVSINCKEQINRRFCRHEQQRSSSFMQCVARRAKRDFFIIVLATRCDNRPECARMEDECSSQCDPRPSFSDNECGKKSYIPAFGNRVCDGYINRISDGSDNCSREVEKNCTMRFSCKSKGMVSIDIRYYCDGKVDCDDHSDVADTLWSVHSFP